MTQPNSIHMFVSGVPKGQPRPRAFARNGMARMYDPGTAEGWKAAIADEYRRKYNVPVRLSGPVYAELRFAMPRPKSHFTKKGLRPNRPMWFTGKPDADNLAKAVMDAFTQLRVWDDDSQVAVLSVTKCYSQVPGCLIVIREAVSPFAPDHRGVADETRNPGAASGATSNL